MTGIAELILNFCAALKLFPNHHLIDSQRLTAKVIHASSGQTVFTLWQYFCIWSDRRWKNKHHLFASINTAFTCQPRTHAEEFGWTTDFLKARRVTSLWPGVGMGSLCYSGCISGDTRRLLIILIRLKQHTSGGTQ